MADRVPFSTGITWTRQFDFCGLVGVHCVHHGMDRALEAWVGKWGLGWGNGGSGGARDLGEGDGSSGGAIGVPTAL